MNPDAYHANVLAWKHAIARLAQDGMLAKVDANSGAFIVDIDEGLQRSLEHRQFGRPLALGTAVREAVTMKELIPLTDFLKSQQSIYQHGWSELPWNVVTWALRQFGVADGSRREDKVPGGPLVIRESLEAGAVAFAEAVADRTTRFERTFTKAHFQAVFAASLLPSQRLSAADVDVLLCFLSRDKGIVKYDGNVVRINQPGEPSILSDDDKAIASLKELTFNLQHQVGLLSSRIDELTQAAKEAVVRKNRVSALAALKSKKIADSSLANRYASLNKLEEVVSKIEQAVDNVQLVKIMETSTLVLAGLNKQLGTAERVDGIMDGIREQMASTDEIAAILAESSGIPVDEAEIDEELEALENKEKAQVKAAEMAQQEKLEAQRVAEAQETLDGLPGVPEKEDPRQENVQTPTRETGIAELSISDTSGGQERTAEVLRGS